MIIHCAHVQYGTPPPWLKLAAAAAVAIEHCVGQLVAGVHTILTEGSGGNALLGSAASVCVHISSSAASRLACKLITGVPFSRHKIAGGGRPRGSVRQQGRSGCHATAVATSRASRRARIRQWEARAAAGMPIEIQQHVQRLTNTWKGCVLCGAYCVQYVPHSIVHV